MTGRACLDCGRPLSPTAPEPVTHVLIDWREFSVDRSVCRVRAVLDDDGRVRVVVDAPAGQTPLARVQIQRAVTQIRAEAERLIASERGQA